jgi:hypothetical protein
MLPILSNVERTASSAAEVCGADWSQPPVATSSLNCHELEMFLPDERIFGCFGDLSVMIIR